MMLFDSTCETISSITWRKQTGGTPQPARPHKDRPIQPEQGHGRTTGCRAAADENASFKPLEVARPRLKARVEQPHAAHRRRVGSIQPIGFDVVAPGARQPKIEFRGLASA